MRQLLNDPQQQPTPDILRSVLGENFDSYIHLTEILDLRGIICIWNYYRDGKSWLGKVVQGRKTIFWLSVWEDCFKTSFFFTEKSRSEVEKLEIDPKIKEFLRNAKATGKLIPLILEVRTDEAIPDIEKLIDYKKKY